MPRRLTMTVLIDNLAPEGLACEWGLSLYIETEDRRLLLDTGASGQFADNAAALGIDLRQVDAGILSHAHYDHSDGMDAFLTINRAAPFLLREGCGEYCFGVKEGRPRYIGIRPGILEDYADRIRYVRGVYALGEGLWLVPHRPAGYSGIALRNELYVVRDGRRAPDDFSHEQSLVVETEAGLVVFNSCSHTGVVNVLRDIRELLGREDVCAYVGGLHLYRYADEALDRLCDELRSTHIQRIFTGHCTGDHAFGILKAALGDRIEQFRSGFRYRFA